MQYGLKGFQHLLPHNSQFSAYISVLMHYKIGKKAASCLKRDVSPFCTSEDPPDNRLDSLLRRTVTKCDRFKIAPVLRGNFKIIQRLPVLSAAEVQNHDTAMMPGTSDFS